MPASYFLGTRLLGSSSRPAMWDDATVDDHNVALFCPLCGEIWGRIHQYPGLAWHAQTRFCARHFTSEANWGGDSAGSFIASWRRTFQELPPEVLEYEAQLRLDRFKEEQCPK